MRKNKKAFAWLMFLFIIFAISSFIAVPTGLGFIPIIVWFLFFISIVIIGVKNVKNKGANFINKIDEEINKKENNSYQSRSKEDIFANAVKNTRYDKCDNDDCDSHLNKKETKKCPLCATMNDANAVYCKICGEKLDEEIF